MPIWKMRFIMGPIGMIAPLALLAGCGPANVDRNEMVGNAISTEENIVDAADDRADHLDDRAAELAGQADQSRGAQAADLRNQSDAMLEAAEQVRQQGQTAGADAADEIEARAGLINAQQ